MEDEADAHVALSPTTVQGLLDLARDLAGLDDLSMILERIVQAVKDVAAFECATLNLVTDTGDLRTVAVKGPDSAVDTLLGSVRPRSEWDLVLAAGRRVGGVFFDDTTLRSDRVTYRWMSDDTAWFDQHADEPGAWRADYLMFAPMHDANGVLIGVVCVDMPTSGLIPDAAQVTTLELLVRQAERAIVASQALARASLDEHTFASMFEASRTPMAVSTADGRLVRTNPRFRATFGRLTEVHELDALVTEGEPVDHAPLSEVVAATVDRAGDAASMTLRIGPESSRRWFAVSVLGVGSRPTRAICTFTDVTTERRIQAQYEHDAAHDALTGVLNRRGFSRAVDHFYATHTGDGVAVLTCDLDDFKSANDEHGHLFGDDVLIEVAHRLDALTPAGTVIARTGGDEFAVVKACSSAEDAEGTAAAIRESVVVPVPDGDGEPVTVSVGVAFGSPPDSREFAELFRRADEAMLERKRRRGDHSPRSTTVDPARS